MTGNKVTNNTENQFLPLYIRLSEF